MPLLSRILTGITTGGISEAVRAIDNEAGHIFEDAVTVVNPAAWVGNGVTAAVQAANGDSCQAAASVFRAIPFNPIPVGSEIHKLFSAGPKSSDFVGKKTLFHITNVTNANQINSSKKMKSGSEGVLGGAIYGALSEEACLKKTRSHTSGDYGVIEMEVDLGYCKQIAKSHAEFRLVCDGGMNAKLAQKKGFHSIGCNFNGGQEYAVFDADRVKVRNVIIRRGSRSRSPRRR